MKMKILISVFIWSLFLGCSKEPNTVLIRVKNSTPVVLEDIIISTPTQVLLSSISKNYGDLDSGESTDFKSFDYFSACCPQVQVIVDVDTFFICYIDCFGNCPLENGKHTLQILEVVSGFGRCGVKIKIE